MPWPISKTAKSTVWRTIRSRSRHKAKSGRMNWKGEPLVSFETVVKMISATKTQKGLRVNAVLDRSPYETGVKISEAQMKELNIQPHKQNPEWNYSLLPRAGQSRLK